MVDMADTSSAKLGRHMKAAIQGTGSLKHVDLHKFAAKSKHVERISPVRNSVACAAKELSNDGGVPCTSNELTNTNDTNEASMAEDSTNVQNLSPQKSTVSDTTESISEDSDGLPTFKNSVGKTFDLDLTGEVKDYIKDLWQRAQDENEKKPTLYEVKCVGARALAVLLRYNDRAIPKGATKEELAKCVHDYILNGCPPRCPKCKRGSLRFSNGKKKSGKRYYWCPGSSTNGRSFYGCNFKANKESIERVPWKNPD